MDQIFATFKRVQLVPFIFLWFDFVIIMIVSMCSLLCDLVLFMGNNVGRKVSAIQNFCQEDSPLYSDTAVLGMRPSSALRDDSTPGMIL